MVFRFSIVLALVFSGFARLAAADAAPADKLSGLVSNSPFGSGKSGAAGAGSNGETLEFRAVLEEGGNKYFSIYDTATRRSNWVELNDPVNGFSVKGYDAAKENITVEYQGKSMTLAIKRAPAVAQAMQPQPMPANNATVVGPGGGPIVQTAPSATDQQRIQQIQEEIRRRRALRNQSMVPSVNPAARPNYGGGPQPMPSNSSGPVPMPANPGGPQPVRSTP